MAPPQESSLFRSELMSLIQLYIPSENAQPTIAELGDLGCIQFRDLNPDVSAFQRAFVGEIRRLDEMERRLRFLITQTEKAELPIKPALAIPTTRAKNQHEIDELESRLFEVESKVQDLNGSQETLKKRYLELTEMRHVLRETAIFFEEAESRQGDMMGGSNRSGRGADDRPLLESDIEAGDHTEGLLRNANLGFVSGVIERRKMGAFERILWRSLRGNLYMNSAEIDEIIVDPVTDEEVYKTVFIIFAHGRELLAKIKKISESLGATLYQIDPNPEKRREDALEVIARIEELNNVLYNTNNARRAELSRVADSLDSWSIIIKKEKAIYHTMNLFNVDANRKTLIAEGWCPTSDIHSVHIALKTAMERSGSMVPSILNELRTVKEPPTYHRTNKFTSGFQAIIDAYGVARYREVNPGLFTVITFPFLFAVMFGDFGHGWLMTFAAVYLCLNERNLAKMAKSSEIFKTFYGGRYIILLMGIFSIYAGLIYNDMFSRSLSFFSSGWEWEAKGPGLEEGKQVGVYPVGVDWAWQFADNRLLFLNSYKMKEAIIFGVVHMTFGIVLNLFNHTYFKKPINIYCEFIPQIIFMQAIFGYLVICILYKWSVNWAALGTPDKPGTAEAPGLLNMLIFMFLQPGTIEKELYKGQATVQVILVLVALVCVPWMLCVKPYLLRKEHMRHVAAGYATLSVPPSPVTQQPGSPDIEQHGEASLSAGVHGAGGSAGSPSPSSNHGEDMHSDHFDFGEIVIHQVIHTIEFCLGCISNTASYLRLWALSLAHAQLSEVLWDMTLNTIFSMSPSILPVTIAIGWYFWFALTIGILLIMEGLSAFLHALRLHWVEFNGKFYEGSGKKFMPFSFQLIIEGVTE
ncbi:V-type ATPase, V0 complex, 116kDa subunit family [Paraphysoderma sedebokerense]|nr:V-type ATPase, V0 complex, 116kDa subunit family [Paraphysoderma sedebokerense]